MAAQKAPSPSLGGLGRQLRSGSVILLASLALLACQAWGSESTPADGAALPSPLSGTVLVRLGLALGVVIAAILGLVFFLRRLSLRRNAGRGVYGPEILSTTHIGPRQALLLIRVCDQVVLVGATRDSMSNLGTFPIPAAIGARATQAAPAGAVSPARLAPRPSFLDYVDASLRRGKNRPPLSPATEVELAVRDGQ